MGYYKCPQCGSTDVHWWEETVVERQYKIRKDGKHYKTPYLTEPSNSAEILEGVQCNSCYNYGNINSWEFELWIKEEDKK